MIGILERLLQMSDVPILVGMLLVGTIPAVAGGWLRRSWRTLHDVFVRQWPAHRALARRYRRDPRTARAITQRLHTEVRLDFRRWMVTSLGWLAVTSGTAWVGMALLERAWVRDQLERTLDAVPVGLSLLLFAGWSGGLVVAVRGALDRRSRFAGERTAPAGMWPAWSRAVPVIFVLVGAAAWLSNQIGYPVEVALVAVLLPMTGILVLTAVQDRIVAVQPYRTPLWVLQLMPELAVVGDSAPAPVEVGPVHDAAPPTAAGVATPLAQLGIRARASIQSALAGLRTLPTRSSPDARRPSRNTRPDLETTRLRWSDLSTEPEPLTSRDPRQLGHYRLHDRLGSGGMAVVFRATSRSGQEVAVKIPSQLAAVEAQVQRRLAAEMAALSRIDVTGVVRIREASSDDGLMFIAMDYLRGPTLDEAVTRLGPFDDVELVRALANRTAKALAGIHRAGVTHRDLKPRNLILTDSGPVMVDLGIAKVADASVHLTATGTLIGSAGYLPPEAHRNAPVGHTADVWAWGCCMALAVSGRALFGGDNVHAILAAVLHHQPDREALAAVRRLDPALARVVDAAIHPDPHRRPQDGTALVAALPPSGAWTHPPMARLRH